MASSHSTDLTPGLRYALEAPDEALRLLDKLDAEASLIGFIRALWPVVEPGRPFVSGWAIEGICEHLEAVTRGEIRRLLINVPPGFMKSLATCVFWPAWEWGPRNRPDLRYILTSYVSSLSIGNALKLRRLVESDVYRRYWGDRFALTSDQNAKMFFENDRTGFALATSTTGVGMGKRGDRGIIDDPNNTKEADSEAKTVSALQWYTEVHPTRVNDEKTYAEVVIMQRTGERDVSGLILSSNFGHEHFCVPMEWRRGHPYIRYADRPTSIGWTDPRTEDGELAFPERFSTEGVEDLKQRLRSVGGSYAEAGQLDQLPIPRGGGLFKRKWFSLVDPDDVPQDGVVVRRWDLAASVSSTADFTASVRMRRSAAGVFYVEHTTEFRGTPFEVDERILAMAASDGGGVRIGLSVDPGQAGIAQKAHMARRLAGYVVEWIRETGSKLTRLEPFASQAEGGNVMVVRGPTADLFIDHMERLGAGAKHDDIGDCASGAHQMLITRSAAPSVFVPMIVG